MEKFINVNEIKIVNNTRAKSVKIDDLMESIQQVGLLNPITVTSKKGTYTLIAGHRRLEAWKKLGHLTIRATVKHDAKTADDVMLINLIENIQREEVSPFEEGRYFSDLINKHSMSKKEISIRISKPTTYIVNAIKVFKGLPDKYAKDIVYNKKDPKSSVGKISLTMATQALQIKKTSKMANTAFDKLMSEVKKGGVGVNDMREFGKMLKEKPTMKLEQFKKLKDDVIFIRCDIPFRKSDIERIKKRHKITSNTDVITGLVYKTISARIKMPW